MVTIYQGLDLRPIIESAHQAGLAMMEVYARDFQIDFKEDESPLTEADQAGHAIIFAALTKQYPEIPIISEECAPPAYEERKQWDRYFLVDPLDGTKEFIKRNGEFTVNIALIEKGVAVAGVVYRPVTETTYFGIVGEGAWKSEGDTIKPLKGGAFYKDLDVVKVVASRSHMTSEVESFVEDLKAEGKQVEFLSAGSSLKLCLVAEGAADVYPRFGPTMEWDTGAAHAVAVAAGRSVLRADEMTPLTYNKENLLNPYFIVQ